MFVSLFSWLRSGIHELTHVIRALAHRVQELLVLVVELLVLLVLAIFPELAFSRLGRHLRVSDAPPVAEGRNGYHSRLRLVVEVLELIHMIRAMARQVQELLVSVVELLVLLVLAIFPESASSRLGRLLRVSEAPPAAEGRNSYRSRWRPVVEVLGQLVLMVSAIFTIATFGWLGCHSRPSDTPAAVEGGNGYCLSWRLAVEANNMREWPTVPPQCQRHVESYMTGGQYIGDIKLIVEQVEAYAKGIPVSDDGMDAWVLDVDDTCISNMLYYKGKRYGCDPYDEAGFRGWAVRAECPAIPAVRELFQKLVDRGFKVILLTGRKQETLRAATFRNLLNQEFFGYERLIMRTRAYEEVNALEFKSDIRRQLVEEGYRIWGNVGDQWSDLQGQFVGERTFKIPNPMYFVP